MQPDQFNSGSVLGIIRLHLDHTSVSQQPKMVSCLLLIKSHSFRTMLVYFGHSLVNALVSMLILCRP